jgi:hypothetical protein
LCGTHYNQQDPHRHAKVALACLICGRVVQRGVKADRRPVCSVTCRSLLSGHRTIGSGYDWSDLAMRRARLAGATVIERFDRDEVFERDGWVCGICRMPVDRQADPLDPASPTVDHVIPLSQGGQHTLTNVQCACLRCNSAKQDRITTTQGDHPGECPRSPEQVIPPGRRLAVQTPELSIRHGWGDSQ